MQKSIEEAIKTLNSGGIIIFPTDTAFGIGCRIDSEDAIKRLFKIRKRPENKPTPVLVSSLEMAKEYWQHIPDIVVERLIKPYWPGALTIVLHGKIEKIPSLVRGGTDTVGIRMPDNKKILEVIKRVGVPLLGPSANFHGKKTPHQFEDLDPELVELVDYVISGECKLKLASTVIDCTSKPWKILREGAIKWMEK